jgi:3-oxoacyl-[acyl-carrier protein] reductase
MPPDRMSAAEALDGWRVFIKVIALGPTDTTLLDVPPPLREQAAEITPMSLKTSPTPFQRSACGTNGQVVSPMAVFSERGAPMS